MQDCLFGWRTECMVNETPSITEEKIQDWMVSYLRRSLKISAEEIDLTTPFASYGFDSLAAVTLTNELKDWLGIELPPTLAYEYPNIQLLSKHISSAFFDKK